MPRPKPSDPPTELKIHVPTSVRSRLDLALWSELESRVPHGAYTRVIVPLLREHLDLVSLSQASIAQLKLPAGSVVRVPASYLTERDSND